MTESLYGQWYTTCDKNMVAFSGNTTEFCPARKTLLFSIVLTDNDYKSSNAYQFLKEVAREVYRQVPHLPSDLESLSNLNMCKDAVLGLMSSSQDQRKTDKLSKA